MLRDRLPFSAARKPAAWGVVLVAATATASGCGSSTAGGPQPKANERPGRGGALVVLTGSLPRELDPHRVSDVVTGMAHRVLYRTLYTHIPGETMPVADLAAGPPEVSDDRRTVTVPLRRAGRFGPGKGRAIVARDVAYGLERALADPVAGPGARRLLGSITGLGPVGSWRRVSGIEATADDELVLRLKTPSADRVVEGLATAATTPVPTEVPRRLGPLPATPSGFSGPYVPEPAGAGSRAGRLVLRRNSAGQRGGDPRPAYIDRIEFEVATGPGAAGRTLRGQGVALADAAPPAVARVARRRDTGQVAVAPLPVTRYVALNPRAPALRDVHARRALVAALDRQAMLRAAGVGGEVASHFLPPGMAGYDESGGVDGTGALVLREPRGDLRLAANELRAAGYADGRWVGPAIVAVRGSSAQEAAAARAAQSSLRRIGVRLKVEVVPRPRVQRACTDGSRRVALCLSAFLWSSTGDPDRLLTAGVAGQAGSKVDDAIVASTALAPGALRDRAWAGINRAAVDAAIGAPWRWDERALLVSRDVIGVVDARIGAWDLAFTSLDARARAAE